jgi:hypothetical protein
MQRSLIREDLRSWCSSEELSVNPDKTQLVLFTREKSGWVGRTYSTFQRYTLHRVVKYLGDILHASLPFPSDCVAGPLEIRGVLNRKLCTGSTQV